MRAYSVMAGAVANPAPLPLALVPAEGRKALFRSLVAVLPAGAARGP
jgi:hypothetical protein